MILGSFLEGSQLNILRFVAQRFLKKNTEKFSSVITVVFPASLVFPFLSPHKIYMGEYFFIIVSNKNTLLKQTNKKAIEMLPCVLLQIILSYFHEQHLSADWFSLLWRRKTSQISVLYRGIAFSCKESC